jgi:hypothetical protein
MRPLLRWVRLAPPDRWLVVQALVLLLTARVALQLLPLRRLPPLMARIAALFPHGWEENRLKQERIVWAVLTVAKHIPWAATCLVQAFAGQALLRREGYSSELRIGVARQADAELKAHAWVESDGMIVLGGPAAVVDQYRQFPSMEGTLS